MGFKKCLLILYGVKPLSVLTYSKAAGVFLSSYFYAASWPQLQIHSLSGWDSLEMIKPFILDTN